MSRLKEVWKSVNVLGYEARYEVSTYGNVRSLATGKTMSKSYHKGYCRVVFYKEGKRRRFRVHRLVMLTFVKNPRRKPHVNHLDGNRSNNHISNLEWCTPKENFDHASQVLRDKPFWSGRKHSEESKKKISQAIFEFWRKRKSV